MTLLNRFESFYKRFDKPQWELLDALYDENVFFKDPLLQLEGLAALKQYFLHSSAGLSRCEFEFENKMVLDGAAHYQWVMHFVHPKLKRGGLLSVRGCSVLKFNDRITYHEDYYDLGALLYEHVPVLGGVVKSVKKRLQVVDDL